MGQSPAQPQSDQYSLDNLQLYTRYTRASYFAAFGVEPPPFQVAQPIKRWGLPSGEMTGKASYDLFLYRYVDAATGQYRQNAVSYDVAGRYNLPGATNYPKYVIAATRAVTVTPTPFGGDLTNAINPDYLSHKADADRLASELNAGAAFEPLQKFGAISYRSDESRRAWSITLQNGREANVGTLLKEKYKAGVGAPGHWSDPVNPQWIPDAQNSVVEANLLPEIPIPCRELLTDEVIGQTIAGWVVQRKRLAQQVSDYDLIGARVREIWQKIV